MDSDSFKAISFETAKTLKVRKILLALGSNYQADINLPFAHQELAYLGNLNSSNIFINPDYSTNGDIKPNYSNQCIILDLFNSVDIVSIIKKFKNIELQTGRKHYQKLEFNAQSKMENSSIPRYISLDIDVLAIQSDYNPNVWLILEKRYPLKPHEKVCLKGLLDIF